MAIETSKPTTEEEFVQFLQEAFVEVQDAYNDEDECEEDLEIQALTFEERCVLTSNKGLVVRIGESEFHVTVVQSR